MMRAALPPSKTGANDLPPAVQVLVDELREVSVAESAGYMPAKLSTLGRARLNNSWSRMRSGLLMRQVRAAGAT